MKANNQYIHLKYHGLDYLLILISENNTLPKEIQKIINRKSY